MSDGGTRSGDDLPLEPILLPGEAAPLAGGPYAPQAIPAGPPRRPRVWTVFVLYFLLVIGQVVLNVALLLALTLGRHGPSFGSSAEFLGAVESVAYSSVGILSSIFCTACLLIGATVVAALLSPVALPDRLRLRRAGLPLVALLVGVAGTLAFSMIVSGLKGLGWLPQSPVLEEFSTRISEMSGPTLLTAVLVFGLGPGIGEELFFRGYVQTRLRQRWGPGWAVLCASLMFGIMHFDLVQGLFATLVGVYLGYLTEWTGSIRPAIICHAVNNMVSVLEDAAGGLPIAGPVANAILLAASLVVIGLSVGYLHRRAGTAPAQSPEIVASGPTALHDPGSSTPR